VQEITPESKLDLEFKMENMELYYRMSNSLFISPTLNTMINKPNTSKSEGKL